MKPKIMTKPYGKIYQNKTNVSITPFDIYNLYPVGSIYISVNSTNPSNYFGGTWEQIKDRFLLACGDTYANGAIGGESEHTLTIDEMPSHNHLIEMTSGGVGYQIERVPFGNQPVWGSSNLPIKPTGGGKPHNNMPPYLAVYIWKRIG